MADDSVARRDFYVYLLIREDGVTPFYVGKGCGNRIFKHESMAARGDGVKNRIIRKMRRNGHPVIKRKIAENLTNDEAKEIEIALIKSIGRRPHGPLANLTDGGDGPGRVVGDETRQKMSAARKGRKFSEAHRANMRAALLLRDPEVYERAAAKRRGRPLTDAHKARVSLGAKKVWEEKRDFILEAMKKRPLASVETRAKMSAAQKARQRGPRSEETKAKLREARARQAPMTEEARAKISAALRARPPISEETRQKRRASVLATIAKKKAEGLK